MARANHTDAHEIQKQSYDGSHTDFEFNVGDHVRIDETKRGLSKPKMERVGRGECVRRKLQDGIQVYDAHSGNERSQRKRDALRGIAVPSAGIGRQPGRPGVGLGGVGQRPRWVMVVTGDSPRQSELCNHRGTVPSRRLNEPSQTQ